MAPKRRFEISWPLSTLEISERPNFFMVWMFGQLGKFIFGCSLQKMVNNHHWDIKRDTYQVPRDLLSLKNPNSRTPKLVNCQGFWEKNRLTIEKGIFPFYFLGSLRTFWKKVLQILKQIPLFSFYMKNIEKKSAF